MKRILVVDDEAHVLRVLRLCLEREGYHVVAAADGCEALQRIREAAPDAMVADIQMPRMDGRELCRRIGAEVPERRFPILVMTSMTAREEREWVQEFQNIEFLEKPLSPRRLVSRLDMLLGGRGEVSHA